MAVFLYEMGHLGTALSRYSLSGTCVDQGPRRPIFQAHHGVDVQHALFFVRHDEAQVPKVRWKLQEVFVFDKIALD